MKRLLLVAVLGLIAFTNPVKAETVCKVTDPTGTPLNVRKSPNGQIVRKVKNGTNVYIYEMTVDERNRPWAKIGANGNVWGWAFREFISCYQK